MEHLRSIVYKSPDTTIYNIGTVQRQTSKFSAFKLPSAKGNAVSAQSALTGNYSTPLEAPKRKPTSPKPGPPAKKQSFHIYQEKTSSLDHSLPLRSSNLPRVFPAVLNSTVNLNESVRAVRNGKSTPPLCNCGRRAKKLSVSNAGPNHGRAFYCCPVGKQGGNKKSCGYFKWEYALLKEKSHGLTFNADALTSLGTVPSNSENSSNKKYWCLRPSMRTWKWIQFFVWILNSLSFMLNGIRTVKWCQIYTLRMGRKGQFLVNINGKESCSSTKISADHKVTP